MTAELYENAGPGKTAETEGIQKVTVHRVGTITLGGSLIVYGVLFLAHLFFPALDYLMIFRLWPLIFIILGLEVLLGAVRKNVSFLYDKTAVFLTVVLSLYAMGMGIADWVIQNMGTVI